MWDLVEVMLLCLQEPFLLFFSFAKKLENDKQTGSFQAETLKLNKGYILDEDISESPSVPGLPVCRLCRNWFNWTNPPKTTVWGVSSPFTGGNQAESPRLLVGVRGRTAQMKNKRGVEKEKHLKV